jgi:hypothetical protein
MLVALGSGGVTGGAWAALGANGALVGGVVAASVVVVGTGWVLARSVGRPRPKVLVAGDSTESDGSAGSNDQVAPVAGEEETATPDDGDVTDPTADARQDPADQVATGDALDEQDVDMNDEQPDQREPDGPTAPSAASPPETADEPAAAPRATLDESGSEQPLPPTSNTESIDGPGRSGSDATASDAGTESAATADEVTPSVDHGGSETGGAAARP